MCISRPQAQLQHISAYDAHSQLLVYCTEQATMAARPLHHVYQLMPLRAAQSSLPHVATAVPAGASTPPAAAATFASPLSALRLVPISGLHSHENRDVCVSLSQHCAVWAVTHRLQLISAADILGDPCSFGHDSHWPDMQHTAMAIKTYLQSAIAS